MLTADLSSLARMGNYRYWATFYICRVGIEPPAWRTLEDRIREAAATLPLVGPARHIARYWAVPQQDRLGSRARSASDGLVIRGMVPPRLSRTRTPACSLFWRVAKLALCGREPVLPRKVNWIRAATKLDATKQLGR